MIEHAPEAPVVLDYTAFAEFARSNGCGVTLLGDLIVEVFGLKDVPGTCRAIRQKIHRGHRYLVSVSPEGRPTGYASWHPHITRRENFCMEVAEIGVHPDFRNAGLGALLLQAAENEALAQAKADGKGKPIVVYAYVREDNPDALRFWKRHGFAIAGTEPFPLIPEVNISMCVKTLF
ncbi:MAG: GNAT family N-acetyltransferase [Patescibacteria group bacterium]|jgi:GNAT superfamily N-acetyltransferase